MSQKPVWKPDPVKALEDLLTQPLQEAIREARKQLEQDKAALEQFQARRDKLFRRS